jgi:hypothetical protein
MARARYTDCRDGSARQWQLAASTYNDLTIGFDFVDLPFARNLSDCCLLEVTLVSCGCCAICPKIGAKDAEYVSLSRTPATVDYLVVRVLDLGHDPNVNECPDQLGDCLKEWQLTPLSVRPDWPTAATPIPNRDATR